MSFGFGCAASQELFRRYSNAVDAFTACVQELQRRVGTTESDVFYRAMEACHQMLEDIRSARRELYQHRAQHGC